MAQGSLPDAQKNNSPVSLYASSLACGTADMTECCRMQVLLRPVLLEDFSLFGVSAVAGAVP